MSSAAQHEYAEFLAHKLIINSVKYSINLPLQWVKGADFKEYFKYSKYILKPPKPKMEKMVSSYNHNNDIQELHTSIAVIMKLLGINPAILKQLDLDSNDTKDNNNNSDNNRFLLAKYMPAKGMLKMPLCQKQAPTTPAGTLAHKRKRA